MKLSSSFLGALAVTHANDNRGPVLYGACTESGISKPPGKWSSRTSTILPNYAGEVDNVAECLASCRSLHTSGYDYAGLTVYEKSAQCYCGNEPNDGFDDLYYQPNQCNRRCSGSNARWERCGAGHGKAMNVWSVPPNPQKSDLNGLCVYNYHVKGYGASKKDDNMSIDFCNDFCRDEAKNKEGVFEYYGVVGGNWCYCSHDANGIIPANPQECNKPCSGNDEQICGSRSRMNIYGPGFSAGPISTGCIDYRPNIHCEGEETAALTRMPTSTSDFGYQSEERYGRCASYCLGIPGSVYFNWRVVEDEVGLCTCLSSAKSCSDPDFNDPNFETYGLGILQLTTELIAGKDVKVCQLIDEETGEKINYLPVLGSANKSK